MSVIIIHQHCICKSALTNFIVEKISLNKHITIVMANPLSTIFTLPESSGGSIGTLNAGGGLTGGGDMANDITIALPNTALGEGVFGSTSAATFLEVDAFGRIQNVSTSAFEIPPARIRSLVGLDDPIDETIINTSDNLLVALQKLNNRQQCRFFLGSLSTGSNANFTTVSDLAIDIADSFAYQFDFRINYQTALTSTGIALKLGFVGGSSGQLAAEVRVNAGLDGTASFFCGALTTTSDFVVATAAPSGRTYACVSGTYWANSSGTLSLEFRSEIAGSQVTVIPGSTLVYTVIQPP
jgi:hypothetical protein